MIRQRRAARDRPRRPAERVPSEEVMKTRKLTIDRWRREAPQLRAKSAQILAGFGPPRREKPRDRTEAEFLRSIGAPERLIGPVA
jgi:hypothetical protein